MNSRSATRFPCQKEAGQGNRGGEEEVSKGEEGCSLFASIAPRGKNYLGRGYEIQSVNAGRGDVRLLSRLKSQDNEIRHFLPQLPFRPLNTRSTRFIRPFI